jgi:hypothetical protein
MATAVAYDQWDDPGLAFSEEEIAGYLPTALATQRIEMLCYQHRVILRAVQVGAPKPVFWAKAAAKLLDVASWYAQAVGVTGIDREACGQLPDPKSAAGKELTVVAQRLEPDSFITALAVDAELQMRYVVTIGRKCAGATPISKWGKKERSLSNKLANAVKKEIDLAHKLSELLASNTK